MYVTGLTLVLQFMVRKLHACQLIDVNWYNTFVTMW